MVFEGELSTSRSVRITWCESFRFLVQVYMDGHLQYPGLIGGQSA